MKVSQQGFTLIELLIVTAIIGVLASHALPAYELYSQSARFTEAKIAAGLYQIAVVVAANAGRFSARTDINKGTLGMRDFQPGDAVTHGIHVHDGVIILTGKEDGTPLDGVTVLSLQTLSQHPLHGR